MTVTYRTGNLLDAHTDALVNTVNTIGVMGKGIALMFKERYRANYRAYVAACRRHEVRIGSMFVTQVYELNGPRWIVNFPTKMHWRDPSRLEWVVAGLQQLRSFILEKGITSIAVPPLGAGNGGLHWPDVRAEIERALGDLPILIEVYEPSAEYLNVRKARGIETLTPARALIIESIRRYSMQGIECSLLEAQKLAWFIERATSRGEPEVPPLQLSFVANRYGPYAQRLQYMLDDLDGSYLHAERRIADANPKTRIWIDEARSPTLAAYFQSEGREYVEAVDLVGLLISGFESPYGLELLATVDWLLEREHVSPCVPAVREAMRQWPGGQSAAERKVRVFDDDSVSVALARLTEVWAPMDSGGAVAAGR